jgi:ATP-dependent RNA helicase DDX46/PRP5
LWKAEKLAKEKENAAKSVNEPVPVPEPKKATLIFGKPVAKSSFKSIAISRPASKLNISSTRIVFDDADEEDVGHKPRPDAALAVDSTKVADEPTTKESVAKVESVDKDEAEPTTDKKEQDNTPMDEDEEDPLDAFMANVGEQIKVLEERDATILKEQQLKSGSKKLQDWLDEEIVEEEDDFKLPEIEPEINYREIMQAAADKVRKVDVLDTDHSTIDYEDFRSDFYKEPPDVAAMTQKEADERRIELDGIQIRGKRCPKPVERWSQFGLPPGCDDIIKKILRYDRPSPIQAQAIPAIMAGRDVIGIARTGSGKTIAFLLPLFRHVKDQRPVRGGEGPIGLILTPTRELATQIFRECKHFLKVLNLRAVCCYGGAPLKDQIADLKRGCEIIICTPGRMIDLLCANGGRITNLKRVTYLCLDEADRMFDLGFEPQVMKIVQNVRPDRQSLMFSATFPKKMEALAYKILRKPLGITVGARSVVAADVEQIVEVHANEDSKFLRLLAILGQTASVNEYGKTLIFVDRQDAADTLMSNLMARSYPCQSIHGGKDQSDRDQTILDFKAGNINILIATSIAARGLDVKDLLNVVNYECPNHMEDYVHRCGRTGRAGNKGKAYTFITPDQERYAADIVKALNNSKVPIPFDLREMLENYEAKIRVGQAISNGGGFGGKGLKQRK